MDVRDIWKPNVIEDRLVRPAVMKRFNITAEQYEACKGDYAPFWVAVEEIKKEIRQELSEEIVKIKRKLARPKMIAEIKKHTIDELELMGFICNEDDPNRIKLKHKDLADRVFNIKGITYSLPDKLRYLKNLSKCTKTASFYAKLMDVSERHIRRIL